MKTYLNYQIINLNTKKRITLSIYILHILKNNTYKQIKKQVKYYKYIERKII